MKAKKLMCVAMAGVVTSGVNLTPYSAAASAPHCDGYVATFTGTRGANYLIGTPKDDVIVGRGGNDSIDGKGGNDIICGGRGDDTVRGGRGKDRIFGQVGDDRFDAGNDKGDDSLNGGHGQDLLLLSFQQGSDLEPKGLGPAHVDLAAGYARIVGGGRDSIALGTMEDVYGTSWGDVIRGDDRANVLHVGVYDGAARLIGRGGDDTLVGGQDGGVYFDGGDGDDLINLISGTNGVHGGAGTDELSFCGPYAGTGYDAEVDLTQGRASTSMHGNEDADGPWIRSRTQPAVEATTPSLGTPARTSSSRVPAMTPSKVGKGTTDWVGERAMIRETAGTGSIPARASSPP